MTQERPCNESNLFRFLEEIESESMFLIIKEIMKFHTAKSKDLQKKNDKDIEEG